MHYRHTPVFQALMQRALVVAMAADRQLSDQAVVDAAKLECSRSTLYRFRHATLDEANHSQRKTWTLVTLHGRYLNEQDARRLWSWLSDRRSGHINRVIAAESRFSRKNLYALREVANPMAAFYACHESQLAQWREWGIEGDWYAYKPSFRRPGFVVKSLVSLRCPKDSGDEFVEVSERQWSSGAFEIDGKSNDETSVGFGVVKSNMLWLFMREEDREQPRIACFHTQRLSKTATGKDRSVVLTGMILEGNKRFPDTGSTGSAYSWNIVMVAKDIDEAIYKRHGKDGYRHEEQVDMYPVEPVLVQQYSALKDCKDVFVPPEILNAITHGTAIV